MNSDAGGDGYTPIVYENQAGETLIFEIYHHNPKFIGFNDAPNINCVIALQNKICPGYPKYFSSVAGDSGASQPSNPNTISTTNTDYLKFKGVFEALQTELGNNFPFEISTHPTYISCEVNLAKVLQAATGLHKFNPISKFSPIIEDINITLNTKYDALINQIKKVSPLIKQVDLIDKYGDKLTLRLTFHSDSKQLSSLDLFSVRKALSRFQ